MKCITCKYFQPIESEMTPTGICKYPVSYCITMPDHDCLFEPKPYTCADCDRLENDTACLWQKPEDSAYQDGELCWGFIDKHMTNLELALTDWALRGYDIDEKIQKVKDRWKSEFKAPWD